MSSEDHNSTHHPHSHLNFHCIIEVYQESTKSRIMKIDSWMSNYTLLKSELTYCYGRSKLVMLSYQNWDFSVVIRWDSSRNRSSPHLQLWMKLKTEAGGREKFYNFICITVIIALIKRNTLIYHHSPSFHQFSLHLPNNTISSSLCRN